MNGTSCPSSAVRLIGMTSGRNLLTPFEAGGHFVDSRINWHILTFGTNGTYFAAAPSGKLFGNGARKRKSSSPCPKSNRLNLDAGKGNLRQNGISSSVISVPA